METYSRDAEVKVNSVRALVWSPPISEITFAGATNEQDFLWVSFSEESQKHPETFCAP